MGDRLAGNMGRGRPQEAKVAPGQGRAAGPLWPVLWGLLPSPLSLAFLCSASSPAGKGNPQHPPSPGARWELGMIFRFLYCELTLPHIKSSSHVQVGYCAPGKLSASASGILHINSLGLICHPEISLQTPSWAPTPVQSQLNTLRILPGQQ